MCLFLTATARAADTTVSPPSTTFALLRVAGALALVIALFFGGAWLFRNWQRFTAKGRPGKLAIVEAKSLGPRHALYVVGYEKRRMLIGSSPTGFTMLSELPEGEPAVGREQAAAPNFADALLHAIGRKS